MNPTDGGSTDELPGIAPRLRDLRRNRGLTLEAAAGRAGLSPAHLSRLETGRRQPSLPMLLGLARVYGTTVSELLGEMPPERDAIVRGGPLEGAGGEGGGWLYRQAGGSGRAMQALRVRVPYGTEGDLVRGPRAAVRSARRARRGVRAAGHRCDGRSRRSPRPPSRPGRPVPPPWPVRWSRSSPSGRGPGPWTSRRA